MRFARLLLGNLNREHWNRRVWEVGYNGPPLPKKKATKKPPYTVTSNAKAHLMKAFYREWNVMQWLTNPYLTEEQEQPYLERHGDIVNEFKKQKTEQLQAKMPNKPKFYKVTGALDKKRANVGNLLHQHRTVEDQLGELIRRNRWD